MGSMKSMPKKAGALKSFPLHFKSVVTAEQATTLIINYN